MGRVRLASELGVAKLRGDRSVGQGPRKTRCFTRQKLILTVFGTVVCKLARQLLSCHLSGIADAAAAVCDRSG